MILPTSTTGRAALLTVLVGLTGCSGSQSTSVDPLLQEAESGMDVMSALIDADNAESMGFQDLEELENAALGTPLFLHHIPLDALAAHDLTRSPQRLLVDGDMALFPVMVDGDVRSLLSMRRDGGAWRPSSIGRPAHALALVEARQRHAQTHNIEHEEAFIVDIPSMNLTFIAHANESGLMMSGVFDHDQLGVDANSSENGRALIERLHQAAQTFEPALIAPER